MNILIVDDNRTNLKLMSAQLEAEGHDVAQAPDGVAALERLDGQHVAAMISDILMPRMDGYRLCHEIRHQDRLRHLPIIIYSSTFTSTKDVKLALDAGADKYLIKPASLAVILAALNEVIDRPHTASNTGVLPEIEVLKQYSTRLVDKLEEKKNALGLANTKLIATGEQLAHLIRHSPAVLYSLKVEGEQLIPQTVSENVPRLFGFTVEEACSFDWWVNHLHPEDRERALAGIPEVIKAGKWSSEYRIRHQAGHYLWVEDMQQLVRNAEGKPTDIVGVWTNITERKQAETISHQLAAIVESSDDAIIGKDLNSIITSWNKGAENIFGYPAGEMIGTSILRLIPADRQAEENQILGKIRQGKSVLHFDTLRQTKDGRMIDVSITASPIKDAGGHAIGVSKVARDISNRKQAAAELLESRRFLRSTLDALSSHIAILDEHGTIVEVNAAWNRFARENQFIGNHGVGDNYLKVCDSVSGDCSEEANSVAIGIRAVMAGQQAEFHLEYPCHSSQERRWFVVRATRFAGDRPVRVVVAHENITERKLAEGSLRESEEKFRQIAETVHEVFWITDSTMHQIIYVSPAYEKIWGRTCASLYATPRQWLEVIHPEDGGRVAQAAAAILTSGSYDATYRILRPDKTERWIHDKGFPVRSAAGEIYRIVGTAEDITEKRKLEDAYRQAQKMESIGQLAGGIAHDFNNILAAILGNLYLARMDAAGQPAILEHLEQISEAGRRATELVKQILAFSRHAKPEREPLKLNDIVIEALKLLRSSLPATIRIETSLTEMPVVLANATAIHQVIMNLGTNAWHALRDQTGVLKVEMRELVLDEDFVETHPDLRPGRYVQLSVSDTGCGMDPAMLEHIFEPFFTTKGVGEGTGLGLAVVHGIMKSHDGGISVYSQPGEGTTFHLYFPAIATEVLAQEIAATPIPRGHGEHIMFLDDEEVLASVGKRILNRLGYVVTALTNPLEAITAVRDQPAAFDLVISDLTMPGMDGIKLGGQLLQLQPHLPIIIMSGFSGALTAEKVRELGFRELLCKPCTPRELAETVHRILHPAASIEASHPPSPEPHHRSLAGHR